MEKYMKELKDRHFKIWTYTVSHSLLILRSPQIFPDMDNFSESYANNLDIEFTDVQYLDIPSNLYDIRIEISTSKDLVPQKILLLKNIHNSKVFRIVSENVSFYILAHNYIIGKNNWISDDRISNPNLQHDQILITSY